MKALSILQPWAWLIVHGHKDVENRRWSTAWRGEFLVHAGKRWGPEQRDDYLWVLDNTDVGLDMPAMHDFETEPGYRGGIVGLARIVDCVDHSTSPWFNGPYGFVLKDARPTDFVPWKGRLGWFDVPTSACIWIEGCEG